MKRKLMLLAVVFAFAVALAVPALVPAQSQAPMDSSVSYAPNITAPSHVADPICPPNIIICGL